MVQELVFTSAKRGLEVGKSGFCTVASSAGMASNLARLLQSLSGYRHLNAPGTPAAAGNPVIHAHLKTKVGGKEFSILSRICDANIDYSNRSNKLAHHFAIDRTKRPGPTPVEILADESQFYCQWNEEPKKLPPRTLVGELLPPTECNTWYSIVGDKGWAGDLVEAVIDKRPVYLIVNEQTPALKLISEAISLLPRQQQWDATFSTFFTKLPPSVDCAVRCVMAGSAEVGLARRSQKNLVLDLTTDLGRSQSSYADAARNGNLIGIAGGTRGNDFDLSQSQQEPEEDYELTMADKYQPKKVDELSAQLSGPPPVAPPKLKSKPPSPVLAATENKSKIGRNIGIAAGAAALLLVGVGATVFFATKQPVPTHQVASGDNTDEETGGVIETRDPEKAEIRASAETESPAIGASGGAENEVDSPKALGSVSGGGQDEVEEPKYLEAQAQQSGDSGPTSQQAEEPTDANSGPDEVPAKSQLSASDIKPANLPEDGEFRSHYKPNNEILIATINQALSLPLEVIANHEGIKILSPKEGGDLCIWKIENEGNEIGELKIKVDNDTSKLFLKITNTRALPVEELSSGFKLEKIDVRVVAKPPPPLIVARRTLAFKFGKNLKFSNSGDPVVVHPVFNSKSARALEQQLNKLFKAKKEDKPKTIEVRCTLVAPDTISIDGIQSENPILLEILATTDSNFDLGVDKKKRLLDLINDRLKAEKDFLTNELNNAEDAINQHRDELRARKNLSPERQQYLKKPDFKWDEEKMHYVGNIDKGDSIPDLKKIKHWKKKLQKVRQAPELNRLEKIVLPISPKENSIDSGRYYVFFGDKDAAIKAIEQWESENAEVHQ